MAGMFAHLESLGGQSHVPSSSEVSVRGTYVA